MNYGELKTQFEGLLKRRDLTTTQRDTWLQMSITGIQRVLRVPLMEKSVSVDTDSSIQDGNISVPADLLELRALTITDASGNEIELRAKSLPEVLSLRTSTGTPTIFTRRGPSYVLGQYPEDGATVRIDYWGELDELEDDEDENDLSIVAWDVIVYGALVHAADWFLDKRAPLFKARYEGMLKELQSQADRDELSNAAVSPAHSYPED